MWNFWNRIQRWQSLTSCFWLARCRATFGVSWNDLEKFQAKMHSSRNLITSTIRKSAEVSLRQQDQESRKELEVAKSAESQSWLRYEAVTAALRSQYRHRDIMKMRWTQGIWQAEGTCGNHWLSRSSRRFRRPNRSTRCIPSWEKSVLRDHRSQSVLHWKGRRPECFSPGNVWRQRHMVNLPQSQFPNYVRLWIYVKMTSLCSWKCATTWLTHQDVDGSHLSGIRNSWVGAVVDMNHVWWPVMSVTNSRGSCVFTLTMLWSANRKTILSSKRMMDKVKRLYEWGQWEQHEFDQCRCRIREAKDKIRYSRARKLCSKDQSHHDVCARTQTHVRNPVRGRTQHWWQNVTSWIGWRHNPWFNCWHPRVSSTRRKQSQDNVSKIWIDSCDRRIARRLKSCIMLWFRIQCLLRLPMRRGPTGKISVLNVDISVSKQRGHCWTDVLHPVVLFLGTLADVPELHVHPVPQRLKRQRRHKKRPNSYDSSVWKSRNEAMTTWQLTKNFPRSEFVSSLTRKVFLTHSIVANPYLFPCGTKGRRWRVLPWEKWLEEAQTVLRWCHSEANADDLTKMDIRAHEMLRKFLQSRVWRLVWDPEFSSSKKLKQQKKEKQSSTSWWL